MSELYDISFTTQALVSKYDNRGNVICQKAMGKPITMTALPYRTAMQYSKCDNFKMERHIFEDKRRSSKPASRRGIGNATREVDYDLAAVQEQFKKDIGATKSETKSAAETGDMAAAINEAA